MVHALLAATNPEVVGGVDELVRQIAEWLAKEPEIAVTDLRAAPDRRSGQTDRAMTTHIATTTTATSVRLGRRRVASLEVPAVVRSGGKPEEAPKPAAQPGPANEPDDDPKGEALEALVKCSWRA